MTSTESSMAGSCHCKRVLFIVDNVDITRGGKCNCSYCKSVDSIGIMVPPASIRIKQLDGTDTFISHENIKQLIDDKQVAPSLACYRWAKGIVSHAFCSNCGSKLFIVGTLPENMSPGAPGGPFVSVNLRALDISQHPQNLSDLSKPEKLYYVDGADTFASQQGQPFPGGAW